MLPSGALDSSTTDKRLSGGDQMATTKLDPKTDAVRGQLHAAVRVQGTTTTIALQGEWDLKWQARMRDHFQSVLEGSPETVVLDLSALSFIDSTGIHGVIELERRSLGQNVRLVIVPGPPTVQRPFEILGLTDTLPFLAATPG
jgi:anti-sigma B factor antagonist